MRILSILLSFLCVEMSFSQEVKNYSPDEIIVKLKPSSNTSPNNRLINQKFGIKLLDSINSVQDFDQLNLIGNKEKKDTYLLKFKSTKNIDQLINIYENTDLFEYVEPNFIGTGGGQRGMSSPTDDPYFSRQYGLFNDGSFQLSPSVQDADIDMELAWEIEKGSSSITVAVLDAGLRMNHPEFNGRIWSNPNDTMDGADNDNNGYTDDLHGWDFVNEDNDPYDDHGHGTNVSGIIAAGHNEIGYAGVDKFAKLMTCKILDANNSGLYSWWTEAIYYAVDNGADVINMSVGGSGFSASMQEAIEYAYNQGVTVVACMMNENNDVTYYPAGYSSTIAVGSTNANDERSSPFFWSPSSGSNFGNHIDVVAPGNYIYGLSHTSDTNYDTYWGGTSQATPLVTGLVSLLLSQDQSRTPNTIRKIIRNSAEDQVGSFLEDKAGFDIYYGYGRINAHVALQDEVLSVSDPLNEKSLKIFPNPTTNFIQLESSSDYEEIRVTDLRGTEFYNKKTDSNLEVLTINISDFPVGLYIVNIIGKDNQLIQSKKIIKN
ncbi:S8 family serine peptidase [Marivirga harenae]|uniref:S8 family serine peptidase n=1 Tax=Marivirga harenae TaxID=2010992 RepID=UPI0026E03B4E|nr:S8 family serine peptidase [Marivirga harenae]WKV11220.1 S8 family serine peptidase [Marivirga harenae]